MTEFQRKWAVLAAMVALPATAAAEDMLDSGTIGPRDLPGVVKERTDRPAEAAIATASERTASPSVIRIPARQGVNPAREASTGRDKAQPGTVNSQKPRSDLSIRIEPPPVRDELAHLYRIEAKPLARRTGGLNLDGMRCTATLLRHGDDTQKAELWGLCKSYRDADHAKVLEALGLTRFDPV